jgi:voltage-gated potassium channel
VSARAQVFRAIQRAHASRQRNLLAWLSHAVTTAGLLSMMIDSSAAIGPNLDTVLSSVVIGVWAYFLAVWGVRVWVAPEHPRLGAAPERSRITYLVSPDGIIDLLAVMVLPIGWLSGLNQRDAQLLAIVWTLKYIRESTGLSLILRVMQRSFAALFSVVTVFFVVFLIAATLSYVFERRSQPETFGSIPHAMWWAIVTLTTTGYGDAVPVTAWGRLLAGWVMVGGIVIFALWAGIIANAFTEELRRRHFLETWDLVTQVPFFKDLGAAAVADIVRLLQSQDAAPGSIVIREGDPGDSMYFIVDGEVSVQVKPEPVKLGAGAFFGEMALLFGAPRSATVVVTRPCVLLVLDIAHFRELAGRRPELMDVIEAEGRRRHDSNLANRE